ncbi:MAG: M28 family peptidase, partial [Gammaproteobacteria bacterium]|nr:M28 family peptidase [Gammaproteobacteria bacterium]
GKSSLDEVATTVADFYGRIVKPDQFPDRGLFYRSDQFNLARIGVPALYVKGGTDFIGRPDGWGRDKINTYTAEHYHQPSDELTDDWDFDGLVNDARFGFWAGYLLANDPELPSWNAGDEFEAARKAALAELEP